MPLAMAAPRVMVSAPVPPMMVCDVLDRAGVGDIGQGELVGAGAEVDRLAVGERSAEGDGVGAGAAGDASRRWQTVSGVGEVAEGEAVAAGAEVDRAVG